MPRVHAALPGALLLAVLTAGCSALPGEKNISLYGGGADNQDADLHLKQPDGTDLTVRDVALGDESYQDPPYYGVRLAYWFDRDPRWGLAVDFMHPKAISDTRQVTRVTGADAGVPVDADVPISNHIQGFEVSHGHNMLLATGLYRWFPKGQRDPSFLGRLQPYTGLGLGVAIPHVETEIKGVSTSEYQIAGPAAQGLLGFNFDIAGPVSAFAEYKLTWADLTLDLEGGGDLSTTIWSHHWAFGLTFRF